MKLTRRNLLISFSGALTAPVVLGAQDPLLVLKTDDPERLKLDFNSSKSKVRLVFVFSPTCPKCLHGADEMRSLLRQHSEANLRAYWIWGPFLSHDTADVARDAARRYATPNSVHFWTATPKYSMDLARILRLPSGRLGWDVFLLYKKGIMWDVDPPEPSYWQHQLEILQGEPLDVPSLEVRLLEALSNTSIRK